MLWLLCKYSFGIVDVKRICVWFNKVEKCFLIYYNLVGDV